MAWDELTNVCACSIVLDRKVMLSAKPVSHNYGFTLAWWSLLLLLSRVNQRPSSSLAACLMA